jgi:hypothetical protein
MEVLTGAAEFGQPKIALPAPFSVLTELMK